MYLRSMQNKDCNRRLVLYLRFNGSPLMMTTRRSKKVRVWERTKVEEVR